MCACQCKTIHTDNFVYMYLPHKHIPNKKKIVCIGKSGKFTESSSHITFSSFFFVFSLSSKGLLCMCRFFFVHSLRCARHIIEIYSVCGKLATSSYIESDFFFFFFLNTDTFCCCCVFVSTKSQMVFFLYLRPFGIRISFSSCAPTNFVL